MFSIPDHCAHTAAGINATVEAIVEQVAKRHHEREEEEEASVSVESVFDRLTAATASPSEAGCYYDLTPEERVDFFR